MASKLFSAALVAAAALAAGSSFAGTPIPGLSDQLSVSGGMKTREEAKSELVLARRRGYSLSSTSAFPPATVQAAANPISRAEVKAEVMASHGAPSGTEIERNYWQFH